MRSLAVRSVLEDQRLTLMRRMRDRFIERYRHSSRALAAGDITLAVNGTDLVALLDVLSQIHQLEQAHAQTRTDLNRLLGLAPDVALPLAPLPELPPLHADAVRMALGDVAQRRPDLQALAAGYRSQEAAVRAAILGQFPALNIGFSRASDTGGVRTTGLNVSLSLPLFSGNRGNIAIERATRAQLRAEYRARLAGTETDVSRLLQQLTLVARMAAALDDYLPHLDRLVTRSANAYQQGDIDALTFLNLESTLLNKRLERLSLIEAAWTNRIALDVLLASPDLPSHEAPVEPVNPSP